MKIGADVQIAFCKRMATDDFYRGYRSSDHFDVGQSWMQAEDYFGGNLDFLENRIIEDTYKRHLDWLSRVKEKEIEKISVTIKKNLINQVRSACRRDKTTIRSAVETGLRMYLNSLESPELIIEHKEQY